MEGLVHDIRLGARGLLRERGFGVVAVLALALGTGANTAIFTVVNTVLLRPLPYAEPDRILAMMDQAPGQGSSRLGVSLQRFTAIAEQSRSFGRVGAFTEDTMNLTGIGEPAQLSVMRFSSGVLEVLGIRPAIGRNFSPDEDRPGGPFAVILGHKLWQERFSSDPSILGRAVTLDGVSYSVVGVMPAGFSFPAPKTDLWASHPFEPNYFSRVAIERGAGFLSVIGRLAPGASRQQAQAEADLISERSNLASGARRLSFVTIPLPKETTGSIRPLLLILMAAVAFVLLIACASVANLLLAKASARRREMAIRFALGAGRGRLVRQLLAESLALSIIAAGGGVLLAVWGVRLLRSAAHDALPRADELGVDARVLLFALAVAVLTGLIFGLAPALQVSGSDLNTALKSDVPFATGRIRRNRLRTALIVSQVSLSMLLLAGAGLMIKTFLKLQSVEPGFKAASLLVVNISLPQSKYQGPGEISEFYNRLLEQVGRLPGAAAAAACEAVPLAGGNKIIPIAIDGQPLPPVSERPVVSLNRVTPGFFGAMGIPLLKGREFAAGDDAYGLPVVIINQSLERRLFPGEDPIGRRLVRNSLAPREIVGVVGDVRDVGLDAAGSEGLYVPASQEPQSSMSVLVRTTVPPLSLVHAITSAVFTIDRDQPVASAQTMDQIAASSISNRRLALSLLGIFAAIAMALVSIGIYSVTSYMVAQRTWEMGLRVALGAEPRDVIKLVLREGASVALIGIGLGLIGVFALTRLMTGLLFGLSAIDPPVIAAVSGLIMTIAAMASFFPARRALAVSPATVLRHGHD